MKQGILYALFSSATQAAVTLNYDFKKNGADWPSISGYEDCGKENQSPIDLSTSWDVEPASDDGFNKLYTNQKTDISIKWVGDTSKIAVNKASQDLQTFHSGYAKSKFGATDRFTGVQFHFHAGSEHTVDGVRQDLEMHTVHLASETLNGFAYAAMGIMWSVNDANIELTDDEQKIVDKFFDSMEWDTTSSDPKVAEVPYGDLMMMVNTRDRWVYSGSVTTPPCATKVYWNVLTTIYPLKQSVLDKFKKQLARTPGLEGYGNWREIQKLNGQDPKILKGDSGAINVALLIVMIIFALTTVLFCVISVIFYNKATKSANAGDTSRAPTASEGQKGEAEMI